MAWGGPWHVSAAMPCSIAAIAGPGSSVAAVTQTCMEGAFDPTEVMPRDRCVMAAASVCDRRQHSCMDDGAVVRRYRWCLGGGSGAGVDDSVDLPMISCDGGPQSVARTGCEGSGDMSTWRHCRPMLPALLASVVVAPQRGPLVLLPRVQCESVNSAGSLQS